MMSAREKEAEVKGNFWSSILSEVQNQCDTKLPANKSVLVLGDNASGKTSLVAKLHGAKIQTKVSGLEYTYINVQDENQDDVTRLSVWILHDDVVHKNLLKFALNEQNFAHTLVLLTVSMTTPWNWMDQLQHFMKILTEHVAGLKIAAEEKQRCQARLTTAWKKYCETIDDICSGLPTKLELEALPLPEGVLTNNLGLDVVIVVTKTDYMITLEQLFDFRYEHFDFMQQCLRRFCLKYGAALFYTSVNEDKNCDLLYQYLKHRIYGLPFRTPALVVEKEAVLIPTGWDNMTKINILNENLHSYKPDDSYNDIITQPAWEKPVLNGEEEIQTEDEQAFLAFQQQLLQQDPLGLQLSDDTKRTQRDLIASAQDSPKKCTILENFFKSLQQKKSPAPSTDANEVTGAGGSSSTSTLPLRSNLKKTTDVVSTSDQTSMRSEDSVALDYLARSFEKDYSPPKSDR